MSLDEYKQSIYQKLKFDIKSSNSRKNSKGMVRANSTENINASHDKLKNNYNADDEEKEFSSSSINLNLRLSNPNKEKNNNEQKDIDKNIQSLNKSEKHINTNVNIEEAIKNKIKNSLKIHEDNNINKLIDSQIILNKIKTQEEEFIFFVTYATSKILKSDQNKNDIYISLIFLNEILKKIPDKQFGKICPNIFNIFKSKMNFKTTNEENIFEILFVNYFLTQIIKDYFNNILNEDYNQILETYEDIGSVELLLIILEINDLFIK